MPRDTEKEPIPFVPGYVMLGDGHQIEVDKEGMIVASTDKELLGKRYCEPTRNPKRGD